MTSTIKVDTIQTAAGGVPTIGDLGINNTGTVLQVVQGTQDTGQSYITSTSFVDTGLSVSITPTNTSSKILIIHSGNFNQQTASSWTDLTLYRDISSTLTHLGNTNGFNGIYSGSATHTSSSINYLDSPSTTSTVVYRIYIKSRSGGNSRFNPDAHRATLIAMEIAG